MQTRSKRQRALPSSLLLRTIASSDVPQALRLLSSTTEGLSEQEANQRLARSGSNEVASARSLPWWRQFLKTFINPFVLILVALGLVSYITDVLGLLLPLTGVGRNVGLQSLPWSYFPWLLGTLVAYCVLTQYIKTRYLRSGRSWL